VTLSLRLDPLCIDLAGLHLDNPTMLASGILGYTAETMQTIEKNGAGAIVSKSIGVLPRKGYVNPTVVQVNGGLVNALGLPNPGIEEFVSEIRHAKQVLTVPFVVSMYGYSAEEYAEVAEKAASAGADAVELNVSCPHVKETGSEIGQNPQILTSVVRKVKGAVKVPVFVKLSPNVTDIVEIGKAAAKAGADALTATNTVRAIAIDVETKMPILSNTGGGLSGPAVKPIAVRCVYDLYEAVEVPIVGCGGVTNWQDAIEYILAGATAVQVGTAIATEGPSVFGAISHGISSYLKRKGYKKVEDIVGLSHRS
jgi:dihydroorotate dehydrogenase (NAD+) catalytic subunit